MSWPYREKPFSYFWGPPTAAENWCEEDYIISPYIAEYVNTLTNVVYILLASRGFSRTWGSWQRSLPHLGLLSVGLGSGIFHATLREWPQLSDSLSMIFATAFVLQRLLTFNRTFKESVSITAIISTAVIGFSILHCKINDLNVHSAVFASMVLFIAYRVTALTKQMKNPALQRHAGNLARYGGACAAAGFALWLLDTLVCSDLQRLRRQVGLPWGFMLELHGWWHILTAISAHLFMNLVDLLLEDIGSNNKNK